MATSTTPAVKVLEPATEQILAEVPQAQIEDVEEAIARAKGAFPTWRAMAPSDRAGLLRRFAEASGVDAAHRARGRTHRSRRGSSSGRLQRCGWTGPNDR